MSAHKEGTHVRHGDARAAVDSLQLCVVEQRLEVCAGELLCYCSQLF